MTVERMVKEIIERRKQWGKTRDSDFDWLIEQVKKAQRYEEELNEIVQKRTELFAK